MEITRKMAEYFEMLMTPYFEGENKMFQKIEINFIDGSQIDLYLKSSQISVIRHDKKWSENYAMVTIETKDAHHNLCFLKENAEIFVQDLLEGKQKLIIPAYNHYEADKEHAQMKEKFRIFEKVYMKKKARKKALKKLLNNLDLVMN